MIAVYALIAQMRVCHICVRCVALLALVAEFCWVDAALVAGVCWVSAASAVCEHLLPNTMHQIPHGHWGVVHCLCPTSAVPFAQQIAQLGYGKTWEWVESPETKNPLVVCL